MLELRDVHKAFGPQRVLAGVTLTLPKGGVTCLVGPSGTGKSVTLKLLTGLLPPDQGQIRIEDEDLTHATEAAWARRRAAFGLVFQHGALLDSLTVRQNVGLRLDDATPRPTPAQARRMDEQVVEALARVGLGAELLPKLPADLSGGMRKRVAIARALVHQPRYLFFDEPTTGLDPPNAARIDTLMAELASDPAHTTLVVTHDLDTVQHLGGRVVMLREGTLAFDGKSEDFLHLNRAQPLPTPAVDAFVARYHQRPLAPGP